MDNPLNKVLTKAPPPPPLEVKIRTMRSDIDSMMKSGGGAPSFQNVAVTGLSLEGHQAPTSSPTPMPNLGSFSTPAATVTTPVVSRAPVEPAAPLGSVPAAQDVTPEGGSSGSNIMPIVIVVIVAVIAIGVVGYFAYTIFAK
jgi:hypothetical protein